MNVTKPAFLGLCLALALVAYQNCAPANFTRPGLSAKGAPGACPSSDPNDCINTVESCQGFGIQNKVTNFTVPPGQTYNFEFQGELGQAWGPMTWIWEDATTQARQEKVGLSYSRPMGKGTYYITAKSGGSCVEKFTLVVSEFPNDCLPSAPNGIEGLALVSPPDPILPNTPLTYKIDNFSSLQNRQIRFHDGGSFQPATQAQVTFPGYPAPGTYYVTYRAEDTGCGIPPYTSVLTVQVTPPVCEPSQQQFNISWSPSDIIANQEVTFSVANHAHFQQPINFCFGDGTPCAPLVNGSVKHTYSSSLANQNVVVTASGNELQCGTPLSTPATIHINPANPGCTPANPAPTIQLTINGQVMNPGAPPYILSDISTPVQILILNGSDFDNFQWSLGDGITGFGSTLPPFNYASAGLKALEFRGSHSVTTCGQQIVRSDVQIQIPSMQQTFTIGSTPYRPDVDLYFIVDNSGSMSNEQLALRNGFTQMWQTAQSALGGYNSRVGLFTTGQFSDRLTSNGSTYPAHAVNQISELVLGHFPRPAGLLYVSLGTLYDTIYGSFFPGYPSNCRGCRVSGSSYFGRVTGDVSGYSIAISDLSQPQLYQYRAQPVVKFTSPDGGYQSTPLTQHPFIQFLPTDTTYTTQITDFNARLDLINPYAHVGARSYDPQISPGEEPPQNPLTVSDALGLLTEKESGVCAMARILDDPTLTRRNAQSAFVIISDENDYDVNGNYCFKSDGTVSMAEGYCGTPGTVFNYITGIRCQVRFPSRWYISYNVHNTAYTVRKCIAYEGNVCASYANVNETVLGKAPFPSPTLDQCRDYVQTFHPEYADTDILTCDEGTEPRNLTSNFDDPTRECTTYIPAATQPLVVAGSCEKFPYGDLDTSISIADADDCGPQLGTRLPTTCQNYPSYCQYVPYFDQGTLQIAEGGLSCGSSCQGPTSNRCSGFSGTIEEYIAYTGGDGCSSYSSFIRAGAPTIQVINTTEERARACTLPKVFQPTNYFSTNVESRFTTTGQTLNQAVKGKVDQLVGAGYFAPTLMTFTYHTQPPVGDPGASLGTRYQELVTLLGQPEANKIPLSSQNTNFGPALSQLSTFIRILLERSFSFNLGTKQIRQAYFQRGTATEVEIQSGVRYIPNPDPGQPGRVDVDERIQTSQGEVTVQQGDKIRIVYY